MKKENNKKDLMSYHLGLRTRIKKLEKENEEAKRMFIEAVNELNKVKNAFIILARRTTPYTWKEILADYSKLMFDNKVRENQKLNLSKSPTINLQSIKQKEVQRNECKR